LIAVILAECNGMATRKDELSKLDNKLSLIRSRLTDLYRDRDEIEGELQQKGLKPDMRGILESRLASVNNRIKVEEKEEWDADDERYDALYYPGR
jgi:hypothetical protein